MNYEKEKDFSEKFDQANCFLSIQSGAGGKDACDWAKMLLRMYQRFGERKKWNVALIDLLEGEEGIKKATLFFKDATAHFRAKRESRWTSGLTKSGSYLRTETTPMTIEMTKLGPYGFLKKEKGVHRLVRLSPFNAKKLRHTSFSLVEVCPEIPSKELEIKERDLKIDTFCAGGHGGQNVNKVSSAVRITHLPTGIVVSCQNERSQGQNKETALKVLRSKLLILEEKKNQEEKSELKGRHISPEWGNQIRSYVLHPYKMVNDLQSGIKISQVEKVLDGELEILYSKLNF